MIDDFAIEVATRLQNLSGSALEAECHKILDSGDFQSNVPDLKEAVSNYINDGNDDAAILVMWRTASSGLEKKARYG